MKFFSKITSFFIMIGSNTERRTKFYDYGNLAMIVYYFIQLIGYIYSQFETKTIRYYENDFLAQITQLSSIPFMLIIIHQDLLTKLVYYLVLVYMCILFLSSIFQIILRPLPPSYLINKFIKFYFQNFQWFFLTPFNECMIGIITCGKQAYLSENSGIEPQNCFSSIPFHTIVTSTIGIILVSISGTISVYFFRNYEFLSGSLIRKFSYINLISIYLHQLLIILSFWKLMYSNPYVLVHISYNFLMLCIILDIFTKLPFGFTFETIFYSSILMISIFFGGLIATWILSDATDGIIFLTVSIFLPLIFKVNMSFFYYKFETQSLQFCKRNSFLSEYPLEYIVLLSHPLTMTKESYLITLKYINYHCQMCFDVICPCKNNLQNFISTSETFNNERLYLWIQHQFQKLLQITIDKQHPLDLFEQLTIKYATFLQKYRENQFLSYKNIQDVILNFSKQQREQDYSASFFINLTKKIQLDTKIKIEQENRTNFKISKNEFKTITDLNVFVFYQNKLLKNIIKSIDFQKKIWLGYNNSTISNYEQILQAAQNISYQIQKIKQSYNKFILLREDQNNENILILRIKFIVSLVCFEDFNKLIQLSNLIIQTQKEEYFSSKSQFHIIKYLNEEAVTLKSQVSFYNQGIILQKLENQFNKFFGYDPTDEIVKVDDLLPTKISIIHNNLIDKFLHLGRSDKLYNSQESFIRKKNNLIEKVQMSLTTLLPYQVNSYYFFIFAHLLKKEKLEQNNQSNQQRGQILFDQNFEIFGVSDAIVQKTNLYSEVSTSKISSENLCIFLFIPYLSQIMIDFYKIRQLQDSQLKDNEIIAQDINGFFDLRNLNILESKSKILSSKNHKKASKDISYKQILNELTKQQSQFNQTSTELGIPIQYTIYQQVLHPLIKGEIKQVIYFVIDIQFQDDILLKQKRLSLQVIQLQELTDSQIRVKKDQIKSRSQIQSQNQLASFESDDNGFLQLQARASSTSSQLKSQSGLYYQIKLFNQLIKTNLKPKIIKIITAFFVLQLIFSVIVIMLTFIFFQQKSSVQSNCINLNSIEIDFLDAYTEIISGSRHIIYYRDFFIYLNETFSIEKELYFSLLNRIIISQQHLNQGISRIVTIYNNQYQVFSQSNIDHLEIQLISSNLESKVIQDIKDQSTYYQIMCSVFFMAKQTFSQNISNFLYNAIDPFTTLTTRSIVYYNFFSIAEITQSRLQECKEQNIYINNQFDDFVQFFFITTYIINFFWLVIQLYMYNKLLSNIKFFISIFGQCDQNDILKSIQLCDNIYKQLDLNSTVISKKKFDKLLIIPNQELDILRNINLSLQSNLVKKQNKKDKQINLSKKTNRIFHITCIFGLSILPMIFNFSFQIYYETIKQNIIPINQEAIQAQEIRLNYIQTINKIDLYMIQQFFQLYNELAVNNISMKTNKNIYQNSKILNQLEFDTDQMEQELLNLRNIDFSFFLFNSLSAQNIDSNQKNQILTQDICLLTGCDMNKELFQDRIFSNQFSIYFQSGIIKLSKTITELFNEFYYNLKLLNNKYDVLIFIKELISSNNYQIYVIWGIDIFQFQLAQFSLYFVNAAQQEVINITSVSLYYIILFGIVLLLMLIIIFLIYINLQVQRYNLAKTIVRLIPLQIVIKRNIQKQLQNFEKRSIF